jgi:hypothetical protein
MIVQIRLKSCSQPTFYDNADSTYEKGSFYCIKIGGIVRKYPIGDIFDIKETY